MNTNDGDKGFVLLTGADTSVAGDEFKHLVAMADTVISFDIITNAGMGANAETSVTSLPVKAGSVVYGGIFHNLDQASGTLIAYYR